MGFERLYVFGKDNAVLARDDTRSFVFMPLHDQNGIKPSSDCLTIPSPVSAGPSFSRRSYPRSYTPPATMPTNRISPSPAITPASNSTNTPVQETNSAGTNQPIRRRRRRSTTTSSVLEQAVALRDQLRLVLTSTKDLVRTLKTEKRSQKALQLALDSLKQLQAAA